VSVDGAVFPGGLFDRGVKLEPRPGAVSGAHAVSLYEVAPGRDGGIPCL
jgi:hypothetical protein